MTNNLGPAGIRAAKVIMPLAATSEATSGARLSFDNGLERYELRPDRQPDAVLGGLSRKKDTGDR